MWTWHKGKWFSGTTLQVRLMVGLGGLEGLLKLT